MNETMNEVKSQLYKREFAMATHIVEMENGAEGRKKNEFCEKGYF